MFNTLRIQRAAALAVCSVASCIAAGARAEDRSFDGTGNHQFVQTRGAANTRVIRISYPSFYPNGPGGMVTDAQRPNARTISNALSTQTASKPSARGLTDYIWAWGQFLDHDMSLSTSSNGAVVNGVAHIAVNSPLDPLGPNPIPFVRSNFLPTREQINEVSSYIDASQVYGSNLARAAALRTDGGLGAKLTLDERGLLPKNTLGLPNDNDGPLPDSQMFLAGDVRANENVLLTSLQTVFAREHNRLVDRIVEQQPELSEEKQYQLARKIVGAEMQIITYKEFLPALMGPRAPRADAFRYSSGADASVTNSFAHAAYRYGHSTLGSNLNYLNDYGTGQTLPLRNAFFNPTILASDPSMVDRLLGGAAQQVSEEVDVFLVDDVRNFLFGPPGAGGLDLAALNIQRGRDHGLPAYSSLRGFYRVPPVQQFSQITSNPDLQQMLQTTYGGNINNIDPWIGGLAEDHLPGSSLGPLNDAILSGQFIRTRDGDRLFYLADAAGLYTGGVLRPEIAALINLDELRLSGVIEANSGVTGLQNNVFFETVPQGDFNEDGLVDARDLALWRSDYMTAARGDADADGDSDGMDFLMWQKGFIATPPIFPPRFSEAVPEPSGMALVGVVLSLALRRKKV